MKKWIRLLASFIGSIVALILANYLNFCDFITIIPNDKKYDACLAIYFTIVEALVDTIFEKINSEIEKRKAYVEVLFYKPNEEETSNANPVVYFNDMNMAEIMCKIGVRGNCSNIEQGEIVIPAIKEAEMQFAKRGNGSRINNKGDAMISLKSICEGRTHINHQEDYRIIFQRGANETRSKAVIEPHINIPNTRWVNFIYNKITIKMEEK